MAESYAHSGDTENAFEVSEPSAGEPELPVIPLTRNQIYRLVDPAALVQVDAEGKALTPLMAAILNERRKELYLEGDRWVRVKAERATGKMVRATTG